MPLNTILPPDMQVTFEPAKPLKGKGAKDAAATASASAKARATKRKGPISPKPELAKRVAVDKTPPLAAVAQAAASPAGAGVNQSPVAQEAFLSPADVGRTVAMPEASETATESLASVQSACCVRGSLDDVVLLGGTYDLTKDVAVVGRVYLKAMNSLMCGLIAFLFQLPS